MSELTRLRLALPKGRVLGAVEEALNAAGCGPIESLKSSRRLVVEARSSIAGVELELLLLKQADVPVYVEHGVADIGVAGTDLLYESGVSVLKPFTFDFGGCDIIIGAKQGQTLDLIRRLPLIHVATKYVRFARDYFGANGWPVEIIPLSGSVELAPVLGLADAIVDLRESGRTLKENGLIALDVIGRTHIKLIANRALGVAKTAALQKLISVL
jgi:ATP phosphoribosyltransferase